MGKRASDVEREIKELTLTMTREALDGNRNKIKQHCHPDIVAVMTEETGPVVGPDAFAEVLCRIVEMKRKQVTEDLKANFPHYKIVSIKEPGDSFMVTGTQRCGDENYTFLTVLKRMDGELKIFTEAYCHVRTARYFDLEREIKELMMKITREGLDGNCNKIKQYFHTDIVAVLMGEQVPFVGADACAEGYCRYTEVTRKQATEDLKTNFPYYKIVSIKEQGDSIVTSGTQRCGNDNYTFLTVFKRMGGELKIVTEAYCLVRTARYFDLEREIRELTVTITREALDGNRRMITQHCYSDMVAVMLEETRPVFGADAFAEGLCRAIEMRKKLVTEDLKTNLTSFKIMSIKEQGDFIVTSGTHRYGEETFTFLTTFKRMDGELKFVTYTYCMVRNTKYTDLEREIKELVMKITREGLDGNRNKIREYCHADIVAVLPEELTPIVGPEAYAEGACRVLEKRKRQVTEDLKTGMTYFNIVSIKEQGDCIITSGTDRCGNETFNFLMTFKRMGGQLKIVTEAMCLAQ